MTGIYYTATGKPRVVVLGRDFGDAGKWVLAGLVASMVLAPLVGIAWWLLVEVGGCK